MRTEDRRHRGLSFLGREERDPRFQCSCAHEGSKPSRKWAYPRQLTGSCRGPPPCCTAPGTRNLITVSCVPQTQTSTAAALDPFLPTLMHLRGPSEPRGPRWLHLRRGFAGAAWLPGTFGNKREYVCPSVNQTRGGRAIAELWGLAVRAWACLPGHRRHCSPQRHVPVRVLSESFLFRVLLPVGSGPGHGLREGPSLRRGPCRRVRHVWGPRASKHPELPVRPAPAGQLSHVSLLPGTPHHAGRLPTWTASGSLFGPTERP